MQNIIFFIGYCYYLLLIKTVRARLIGATELRSAWDSGKKVVFCAPHHFLLGLFVGVDAARFSHPVITLVASLSADGELISRLLKKRNYAMVRGSSNRGAQKALLQLQQAGKAGQSLGIAFDGPKGPPFVPKRGIIACARIVDGPMFLIYGKAKPNRFLKFLKPFRVRSWDKFLVPVPFCELEVHFEKLPDKNSLPLLSQEEYEKHLLTYIEARSREMYQ